jgi:hypothetical protein
MQVEEPVNSNDVGRPEVDTLILLDREVRLQCVFPVICNP